MTPWMGKALSTSCSPAILLLSANKKLFRSMSSSSSASTARRESTSARTAALMVSAIVPDVRFESVLAVIQHLHSSKYTPEAWEKSKRTFEASKDVAEDLGEEPGAGAGFGPPVLFV